MPINGRNKGAAAEREFCVWLQDTFKLEHLPERNIEQYRHKAGSANHFRKSTGHDITGFVPFAFEVKRCESLDLRGWWRQAVNSATPEYNVPVVAYRQNRGKWKFLISAKEIGLRNGYLHLEAREFIMWVNLTLDT